ncbi:MAG: hypothetical protein AOA65_0081 [Candidatus Bathyarchaeota archaeon BA1]|nr:MAG: hypothetical protein AOA65_0081 [Candidatus Bathyarchaeota archaeon BA1]
MPCPCMDRQSRENMHLIEPHLALSKKKEKAREALTLYRERPEIRVR